MNNLQLNEHLNIQSIPHPFSVERIEHALPAGMTVEEILQRLQPDIILQAHAHVFINGDYVPRDKWRLVRPKPQAIVTVRMVPQGGGGKNPLRTILSVALMAATPQLGAMLGSGLSAQLGGAFSMSFTQKLITGGLNFAGRLAMNAIAPPSKSGFVSQKREKQTQYIQGTRNAIQPFATIPQVLGRHRMVPPLATKPYTETVGNDQYIRMLFVWGYGPLNINDLKIGETSLEEFDNVEIETRSGYESDEPITLYSSIVSQNDLNVKLTAANSYEARTTEPDVTEISVDITFPNGLVSFNKQGKRQNREVKVEVQYAPIGTDDWTAGAESYKSVSAQNIQNIEAPRFHSMPTGTGRSQFAHYKRIDSIVIDKADGRASIVYGQKYYGYDENGIKTKDFGQNLTAPPVPDNKIEIVRVTSLGSQIGFEVEDRRQTGEAVDALETQNDFEIAIDGSDISVGEGAVRFNGFIVNAKQTVSLRRSLRFQVPQGQYQVRLRRLTADNNDDDVFDEVYWTSLRSIRAENPLPLSGLAVTALRIKATDQLNGTIDQFNGVVTSIVADWDGESWVEMPSENPASLYRHVLQGPANARPLSDDRLDLSKLQTWHERCTENNRGFNAVISDGQSVMDVLNDVAAAGRASPTIIDGRWGVVEDILQAVPVQHFTPRNSRGFESERSFEELPHALRVKFNNRDKGWTADERIVYDTGYDEDSAVKFETLELTGITDGDQAWRDGRYHIASARLRPESYSFYTDIEHIVCTRGDLILLTHDVALAGLASARILQVVQFGEQATGLVLDTKIIMTAGQDYVIRVRCQNGAFILKNIINTEDETQSVTFVNPHSVAADLQPGDLCVFGEVGKDSMQMIVKSIEPQDNISAKITCVDAAPELHNADATSIPEFSSLLTLPPELVKPDAPDIKTIQSGQEVIKINTDGSYSPQIVLTLNPPSEHEDLKLVMRLKRKDDTGYFTPDYQSLNANSYIIEGVDEGEFYDIELKYIRRNNITSEKTLRSNYEVIGLQDPPQNVDGFMISLTGNTAHLSWTPVNDIDLSHYKIKHVSNVAAGQNWYAATDMVPKIPKSANTVSVPALPGYYMIKAVDLGGRESVNASVIYSDFSTLNNFNAVMDIDESASFGGSFQDTVLRDNALTLEPADSIDDWDNIDEVATLDDGLAGYLTSGYYEFENIQDLGAVYTCRLWTDMVAEGLNLNDSIDDFESIDDIENLDDTVPPEKWSSILQVSTTEDDPNDIGAVWSEWKNLTIGDYKARGFKFSIYLNSTVMGTTPSVSMLKVTIDMPDRVLSDKDIISEANGSLISFDNPFRDVPAIAVSAQNMQSGDYFETTGVNNSGFTIQFFDQNGIGVSRQFDYLAKGFGLQNN